MTFTIGTKEMTKKTGPIDEILPVGEDGLLKRADGSQSGEAKYGKAKSFRIGSQLYVQFPIGQKAEQPAQWRGRVSALLPFTLLD